MDLNTIPTLRTPRLVLREARLGDWPEILVLRSDPEVNAKVKRPLAKSKEDALAFLLPNERVERTSDFANGIESSYVS